MLVERAFLIGGAVCWAAGALELSFLAVDGALGTFPFLGLPGALFLVLGTLFVATGLSARRHRHELLALGEVPGSVRPPGS